MSISFYCDCGHPLKAPDPFAGRKTKCPQCSQMMTVPDSSQSAPAGPSSHVRGPGPAALYDTGDSEPHPPGPAALYDAGPPGPGPGGPPGPAALYDTDEPRGSLYDAELGPPLPKKEVVYESGFPTGLVTVVLILVVLAAGYFLFFPGKSFPWEPFTPSQRTPSGDPWGPTLTLNKNDKLLLTMRMEMDMQMELMGEKQDFDALITVQMSSKVMDVLDNGNMKMRTDFDFDADMPQAPMAQIPSFTMEYTARPDGSTIADSVVYKGIDPRAANLPEFKSMGLFEQPSRKMRVGEALDIREVMTVQQMLQGLSALKSQGLTVNPDFKGEVVLEGFEKYDGAECAKYTFDGELTMEGDFSRGEASGYMMAGVRMKGSFFIDKERGYPRGGSLDQKLAMDMEMSGGGRTETMTMGGKMTISITGEYQPVQ